MNRVQVGKGDKDRTRNRKAFLDNYERIFGNKSTQSGRFKQDPETGEWLPLNEWYAKYGKVVNQAPMLMSVGEYQPYISPSTGKLVTTKRGERYDLKESGCRIYEGKEQEMKEAARHREYEEKAFEKTVEHALKDTARALKYQEVAPEKHIKSSWLLGED